MKPLPIAKRPWESVTMNFIIGLPKLEGYGSIIEVVDRFSKYVTFIVASTNCTAKETTRLFLKHMAKYWDCLITSSVIAICVSLRSFGQSSLSLWV